MSDVEAELTRPSRFSNPVFLRELRWIARRGQFEWIFLVVATAMTLVVASLAGRGGGAARPDAIGRVLFHTFFGLAHALVLAAGPAIAAGSIAAEREGRTYEALALTGISARSVVTGKFMAAVAHIGGYVCALAPVGAMPFLFGGVTSLSVIIAYAMLFVFTALAALLGLAISAGLTTTRSALIASVLSGVALAATAYFVLGDVAGELVCQRIGVSRPGTFWLPVVLAEARLDPGSRLLLVGSPLAAALFSGWFLFELAVANLADAAVDRGLGLRRWFAGSAFLASIVSVVASHVPITRDGRAVAAIGSISAYVAFAVACAFVFQGDRVQTPRRLRERWTGKHAPMFARLAAPGPIGTASLQFAVAAFVLANTGAGGVHAVIALEFGAELAPLSVLLTTVVAAAFLVFVVGLASALRTRWEPAVSRVVLSLILLVVCLAPYSLAVIAGTQDPTQTAFPFAALSPASVFGVATMLVSDRIDTPTLVATLSSAATLGTVGLVAIAVASQRMTVLARRLDAEAARLDLLLARDDLARRSSAPPEPAGPGPTEATGSNPSDAVH